MRPALGKATLTGRSRQAIEAFMRIRDEIERLRQQASGVVGAQAV